MAKEIKYRYKLPPCPSYDIEGTESWLTDMAAKGLHLSKDGFFLGLVIFEQGKPSCTRYRLDAAPKEASALGGDVPDEEAVELHERYNWQFVATHGQFYIYRTNDPSARELNTDPQVQDLAMKQVQQRERVAVFSCFLWAILYPLLGIRGNLLLTMLHTGTGFVLLGLGLLTWILLRSIHRVFFLKKLRNSLLANGTLNHRKPWKQASKRYFSGKLLFLLLVMLWAGVFLHKWSDDILGTGKIPLSEFEGTVPFATMADFVPEGVYKSESFMRISNTIQQWEDLLAPVVIDWQEIAHVTLPDGRILEGGLYIDYYEAATPWLAREAAREHLRADRHSKRYKELEPPQVDADYAEAYLDEIGFPTVVIQTGRKVIHATFYQTSPNYTLELHQWAEILAKSLQ